MTSNTRYTCQSDRYCHDADIFEGVDAFLDYCDDVFGGRPALYERNGEWFEMQHTPGFCGGTEALVLTPVIRDAEAMAD